MRHTTIPKKGDRSMNFSAWENTARQMKKLMNITFDPTQFYVQEDPTGIYVSSLGSGGESDDGMYNFKVELSVTSTGSNVPCLNIYGGQWIRHSINQIYMYGLKWGIQEWKNYNNCHTLTIEDNLSAPVDGTYYVSIILKDYPTAPTTLEINLPFEQSDPGTTQGTSKHNWQMLARLDRVTTDFIDPTTGTNSISYTLSQMYNGGDYHEYYNIDDYSPYRGIPKTQSLNYNSQYARQLYLFESMEEGILSVAEGETNSVLIRQQTSDVAPITLIYGTLTERTFVTDIRWDETTHQLQMKKEKGWIIQPDMADEWEEITTAVICPEEE